MNRKIERMIAGWLREVGRRLDGSRAEKRIVLESLREQVYDRLHERSADAPPTVEDLESVLQEIDPPESFGDVDLEIDLDLVEKSRLARIGGWTLVGTAAAAAGTVLLSLTGLVDAQLAVLVTIAGAVAAAAFGFLSWRTSLGRAVGIVSVVLILGATALIPARVERSVDPGPEQSQTQAHEQPAD